ncbi:MAG: hypothetical protein P1V20_20000 [Verrucomicrobiales bacterium]|nr:hypothetical protein [Verrucomicrobiales bacterium]
MSLAKSFTEEQIATVQSWADEGDGLSEIQRKLGSEMDIKVTYMELRFLIDDLGVKLKEDKPEEPEEPASEEEETELVDELPSGDGAKVSISALQRPGALISGSVTFSGGEEADWWLDQMGQLGMNPKTEGFRPNQEQMMSFQQELKKAVEERGGI